MKEDKLNESVVLTVGSVYFPFVVYALSVGYLFLTEKLKVLFKRSIINKKYTEIISNIVGIPVKVYVTKSKYPNAYYAGGKTVTITDSAIEVLNKNEVIAVLIHECGHMVGKDFQRSIAYSGLTTFIIGTMVYMAILLLTRGKHPINHPDTAFGSALAILSACGFIIGARHNERRYDEFLADSYASEYGYGRYLKSALYKMSEQTRKQLCEEYSETMYCEREIDKLIELSGDEHPADWQRNYNIDLPKGRFFKHSEKSGDPKIIKLSRKEVKEKIKQLEKDISDLKYARDKEYKAQIQADRSNYETFKRIFDRNAGYE